MTWCVTWRTDKCGKEKKRETGKMSNFQRLSRWTWVRFPRTRQQNFPSRSWFIYLFFYLALLGFLFWVFFQNFNWPWSYRGLKSSLTVERRTSLPSLTPLNNNNCKKKNPIWFLSFVFLIIFLSWVMNFSPQKKENTENGFVIVSGEDSKLSF